MEAKVLRALIFAISSVLLAGCPRAPEQATWPESERNLGLMPEPAGRILGEKDAAWSDDKFANFTVEEDGGTLADSTSMEQRYIAAADNGQVWAQTRLGVFYARAVHDPRGVGRDAVAALRHVQWIRVV